MNRLNNKISFDGLAYWIGTAPVCAGPFTADELVDLAQQAKVHQQSIKTLDKITLYSVKSKG